MCDGVSIEHSEIHSENILQSSRFRDDNWCLGPSSGGFRCRHSFVHKFICHLHEELPFFLFVVAKFNFNM